MNYTRFSRTGKEQQTLLFFKRSRGNSAKKGNISPVLFSTVPHCNEKKVVTIEFSAVERHEELLLDFFSHMIAILAPRVSQKIITQKYILTNVISIKSNFSRIF